MKMQLPCLNSCISLLAKDNVWNIKIGNQKCKLDVSLECFLAYHIYISNDMYIISGTLRCYDKYILPSEINAFVANFKRDHPLEELVFKWSNIKHYATNETPLDIPNPFSYVVTIEKWQEIKLLHLLRSSRNPKKEIEQWFGDYVEKYALSPKYKRDVPIQHIELASIFCQLHGIDINNIPEEEPIYDSKIEKTIALVWKEIRWVVYVLIYLMAAWFFVWLGEFVENFWLSLILGLVGMAMIFVPLANIFRKK